MDDRSSGLIQCHPVLYIISSCQRARPTATIAREPKLMRFQPLDGQVGLALGAQQFGLARFWRRCFVGL